MNQQPPMQSYSYSTSSSTSRKTKIGSDGQKEEEFLESSESSGNVPPDFDARFQMMGMNPGEGFPAFPQSSLFRGMEDIRSPMSPLSIQTMRSSPLRSSPQPQTYAVSSPASTLRSSPAPPPSTPADQPQSFNSSTMNSPHYKTELFIPVKRHQNTFDDFHMNRWLEHNNSLVDSQFAVQRDDWQKRLEDLKQDFFSFSPHTQSDSTIASSSTIKQKSHMISLSPSGKPEFSVQFDVKHFKPEEVNVSTKHGKLVITAMHEEKVGNSTSRRQVNRQVDIPNDVQIGLMRSVLSKDGILSVTAPIRPPTYQPQLCSTGDESAGQVTQTHTKSYSTTPMGTGISGAGMMVASATASQDALDWTVNVAGFKPQEVNVTVQGRKVIVHACHDEQEGGKKSHNEMRKQFDLPDSVSAENVRSFIRDGNILHIEASLRPDLKGRIDLVPVNYKI